jgi:Ankyrin repeats (many copies)
MDSIAHWCWHESFWRCSNSSNQGSYVSLFFFFFLQKYGCFGHLQTEVILNCATREFCRSELKILKIRFMSIIVKIINSLPRNININAQDNNGYTPLHIAAGNHLPAMVSALLARGASTNIVDNNGQTAKQVAADLGYTDIVNIIDAP